MPTISELTALSALSKLDKFEVERAADSTSYSVTANDIANFVKTTSNGGFRGTTTKSIDEFSLDDIGMWWWVNSASNPTGLTSGIVEIISFHAPGAENDDMTYLQKLSLMDRSYQRMHNDGGWSNWASLANKNGAIIEYGTSTATHVDFPSGRFASTPAVIVTPNTNSQLVCIVNVFDVTPGGFNVRKYTSDPNGVIETIETTEEGTTTTRRSVTTQNAWQVANDLSFNYIAISDVGG